MQTHTIGLKTLQPRNIYIYLHIFTFFKLLLLNKFYINFPWSCEIKMKEKKEVPIKRR